MTTENTDAAETCPACRRAAPRKRARRAAVEALIELDPTKDRAVLLREATKGLRAWLGETR